MSRYYTIIPFFCVLLLSSCAQLPDSYGLYQEPASPWAVEQNNTRLQNISTLIQGGKGNAAKQEADLIHPKELTPPQLAQFNLLSAQILLSFGEAEQAISKLATTEVGQLGINDKIKPYQSQAFSYSLTGNLLESAKAKIIAATQHYLSTLRADNPLRFDVAAISGNGDINWIKNAF
ncbi:MAG: hypothetical protein EXR90_00755 [Methyloglobulus sp.]|nr:hypothetical protein [Methyloglobulus sp.]